LAILAIGNQNAIASTPTKTPAHETVAPIASAATGQRFDGFLNTSISSEVFPMHMRADRIEIAGAHRRGTNAQPIPISAKDRTTPMPIMINATRCIRARA